MKAILLSTALCLGVLAVPFAAQAESEMPKQLKECTKQPMPASCKKDFEKVQKAFEDILNGKKPTLSLPGSSGSLPIGDIGKLLSFK